MRALARRDPRVQAQLRYALTMVCGGASDLIKSRQLLSRLRVQERDLAVFRYRGHGNPGATHVKTIGGEVRELTYERWDDDDTWRIQARCRICPDALGEGADLVAADCWEGGSPAGEDEGFNAILVRTRRGVELFDAAVRAEVVTVTREIGFRDMIASSPTRLKKSSSLASAGRDAGGRQAGSANLRPATSVAGSLAAARDALGARGVRGLPARAGGAAE